MAPSTAPGRPRMASTSLSAQPSERVAVGRLWWVGPLTAVAAAGANGLVYLVSTAAGVFPARSVIPSLGQPVTIASVVINSLVGVTAGVILFALLGWLTRRPITIFRIVAVAALVLSFATPTSVPGRVRASTRPSS